jgi:tetrathionate reductase subunit B
MAGLKEVHKMKVFVIDVARCNGCYNCQIVCKDEHVDNDWSPYARPQPDTGQFWLKMTETTRGSIPKVKVTYRPVLCAHCDEAPCMEACPVQGGIYKRHDGLVVINPGKCNGCKQCIDACPYGAIYFNESLKLAQKCTGCAHLLDKGWKEPRCVDACPTQAIRFGEESEFKDAISGSEILHPEVNVKPRLYYLNLPKKFIAGTVYEPVTEEVIIRARCSLIDSSSDKEFSTVTDGFGDFWFNDLADSIFTLRIESDKKEKVIENIKTDKDVNLGDIPLT